MRSILDSLGIKYEYQLPVRTGFVLDFAFRDSMKAIEVDGPHHKLMRARDAFRDYLLKRFGWDLLRIPIEDLDDPDIHSRIVAFLQM